MPSFLPSSRIFLIGKNQKTLLMEELKKAMLNFIDARERKDVTDRKILRRLTLLVVGIGLCTIMLLWVVIYMISRPVAASVVALKNFEDLNKTILIQRKFNQEDRQDIAE